uniref:Putative secreted protein n=1 Tax=Ixodes ricinus TaxID=34613 RepID=A0A6B0UIF1_IXORI
MSSLTSWMPLLLAAIWACRSARLSRKLRVPLELGSSAGAFSASVRASCWKTPAWTSLKERKVAPSSRMECEWAGMEPGLMPPMSAWWPRLATKNTGRGSPG